MAISLSVDRQSPLYASADFALADVASGVFEVAVSLPENAEVVGGALVVTTAFNSATSDALDVGDAGASGRYLSVAAAAASLLVGRTALVPTGYRTVGKEPVGITWTGVGVVTTGAGRLEVEYVIVGRGTNVQPA